MDIRKIFDEFCSGNGLELRLSFDMPPGYEDANGMFEPGSGTLYYNDARLHDISDDKRLFYLFHELRHGMQYLRPHDFDEIIIRSTGYVIMFDGVCWKRLGNEWKSCRLRGSEEYFKRMYLGQPYERDANLFAVNAVRDILGDSPELSDLAAFLLPADAPDASEYERLYENIDALIKE